MSNERLLGRVRLGPSHKPTGNTQHWYGTIADDQIIRTERISAPAELQIVQSPTDGNIFLYHVSESGNVLTDTWHETIEDAMSQAEFEFGVAPGDWEMAEGTATTVA